MLYTTFAIIAIAALAVVFSLYFFYKKNADKDWIHAIYFSTVFVTGAVLYFLGLSYNEYPGNTTLSLFTIATAIFLTLKSFVWDFGGSMISKIAQDNSIFAVAVFVHYIAAIMFGGLIVIKLFGKNVINRIHIFINKYLFSYFLSKYIVIGTSKQTDVFLQSLSYIQRALTTVILDAALKERKSDLIDRGFAVIVIKGGEENIVDGTHDALKTAGFRRSKIISMSENDDVNLLTAKMVTDYIAKIVNPNKEKKLSKKQERKLQKLKLFAYAMYETLDRTEHFTFGKRAFGRVRFFNPYEVCARKFILENPITSLIPKAWINTTKARLYNESDEGHDKSYRIMNFFVGYGRTNQHIFKKNICNYQLLDTDYNALIIDKNATELEKHFQNTAPGLFNKEENGKKVYGSELNPDGIYYLNPKEAYNIAFENLDVLSFDFYDRIVQEIKNGYHDKNGYDFATVVIALGSDILNIETALELRQKLYERKLLKLVCCGARVRIFVKITKDVLGYHDMLNGEGSIDNEITVFGALDETINESYVIDEKIDLIAQCIANNYWKAIGKDARKTNVVTKWDTMTEFKRESNRCAAMSIRTKLNLLGFEFKERENKTDDNAVREVYDKKYGIDVSKRQREEKAKGKFVDFAERDANDAIIDNARNNLARLEHQRWNTLHLVSGWTKLEIAEVTARKTRQDEKSKQHACITTFEGLSNLRARQADDALAEAKNNGKQLSPDEVLSNADTVCYDFDLMDALFENLNESNYCVTLRE